MNRLGRIFRRLQKRCSNSQGADRQAVYVGDHRVLTTTIYGQRLFVDSRDLSLTPQIILGGCWEPGITQAMMSLVKPGMTIIEIGGDVRWAGGLYI